MVVNVITLMDNASVYLGLQDLHAMFRVQMVLMGQIVVNIVNVKIVLNAGKMMVIVYVIQVGWERIAKMVS